ncbi:MAG: hypothetical protein RSE94_11645 [Pseudomonas sp.]
MITVHITPETPSRMLRAIRAACNELLGETVELRLPTPAAESLADQEQAAALSEQNATPITIVEPLEDNRQDRVPAVHTDEPAEELDSAGQPWDAELHSSSRAKIADGTWKKRRGTRDPRDVASDPAGILIHEAGAPLVAAPIAPPVPPVPTAEPIMPKIFALITSQIVTINQAVEAAQAEGYADLGANGLGGAPVEKQLAVLRKLEG